MHRQPYWTCSILNWKVLLYFMIEVTKSGRNRYTKLVHVQTGRGIHSSRAPRPSRTITLYWLWPVVCWYPKYWFEDGSGNNEQDHKRCSLSCVHACILIRNCHITLSFSSSATCRSIQSRRFSHVSNYQSWRLHSPGKFYQKIYTWISVEEKYCVYSTIYPLLYVWAAF